MNKKYTYTMILVLSIACLMAFGRIAGNDFINFDDNMYITQNAVVKNGLTPAGIRWAFTDNTSTNWHPVTWLSHMLDWRLFGENPAGHHLVNLLFHIGAVIFLFLFLYRTTGTLWPAAFAAAFFALHPLRVESVAWASERKDVLSLFFGMAGLYVYSLYAENKDRRRYFLCLFLFALALLSKSMLITLPFVMLLLDYWPLKRFQTLAASGFRAGEMLLKEKIPFFILAAGSGIVTIWAQHETSVTHLQLHMRVVNAMVSYVDYLKKIFFPSDLSLIYPFVYSFPAWQMAASTFILLAITALVVYGFKKLPFLPVGWFWYLGTLIPVSGLVSVNAPMADHYTYLPSIGIAIMLAWGIPALIKNETLRQKVVFPAAVALLVLLSVVTVKQCGYWKNSVTIFSRALEVTRDNFMAHNNLAIALTEEGQIADAIEHYDRAIAIWPDIGILHNNRGYAYVKAGRYDSAIEDYNTAVNLEPENAGMYNNRGVAYIGLRNYQKAMRDFDTAIELKEDFADAYKNRSLTHFNMRDRESGCREAQKACELGNCTARDMADARGLCR